MYPTPLIFELPHLARSVVIEEQRRGNFNHPTTAFPGDPENDLKYPTPSYEYPPDIATNPLTLLPLPCGGSGRRIWQLAQDMAASGRSKSRP
eukprot:747625-Hanusia_phi.AAC.5